MRSFVLVPIMVLLSFVMSAHAALNARTEPVAGIYSGSHPMTSRSVFDLNETPTIELSFFTDLGTDTFDDGDLWDSQGGLGGTGAFSTLTIDWEWTHIGSGVSYTEITNVSPSNYTYPNDFLWVTNSLSDWSNRNDPGLWTVSTSWQLGVWESGAGTPVSFTVTPEPVSSVLFLLGGTVIAMIRRKQRF